MNFKYDESALIFLKKADPKLGKVIDRLGKLERAVECDPKAEVLRQIIGQQISSKALLTVWDRLSLKMRELHINDVCDLDERILAACGIPSRKINWILNFLEAINNGSFSLKELEAMDDDEAVRRLSSFDGIGKWTAQMILIFAMQRQDILSTDDFGIRRGLCMLYHKKKLDQKFLARIRKRYSPYASVASFYLWAVSSGAVAELCDPAATNKSDQIQGSVLFYSSPLGPMRLEAYGGAISSVEFCDHASQNCILDKEDHRVLKQTKAWLRAYFAAKALPVLPPLAMHGTAFQQRIFALLLEIPYGETVSYTALALRYCQRYGAARMASQAVGRAVGANPLAVLIPCHRVVGSDGALVGYAYGIAKKKALLDLERSGKALEADGDGVNLA